MKIVIGSILLAVVGFSQMALANSAKPNCTELPDGSLGCIIVV